MDFADNIQQYSSPEVSAWANTTGTWAGLAGVVIGGAAGIIKSKDELKATQAQANALNNQSAAQIEIAKLNATTAAMLTNANKQNSAPAPKGLGTGAIVGIVVASVVVIGVITYIAMKK